MSVYIRGLDSICGNTLGYIIMEELEYLNFTMEPDYFMYEERPEDCFDFEIESEVEE